MMRLALLAVLLTAGCASRPAASPPAVADQAEERPVFVQYRPGQAARYRLEAPYDGVLTQRGPCLGVVRDGRFSTLFWPETARIEFGAAGLEVSEPGGAPVRLGDTIEFTGGPLPRGMTHPLGADVLSADTPMACAQYRGYDGWLAIVNPGFRRRQTVTATSDCHSGPDTLTLSAGCQSKIAAPAAAGGAGLLPIAVGAYVAQDRGCADHAPLFRYDGRSLGWSGAGSAERPIYPIRRVREEHGQWVATIVAPGPGPAPVPRELDVVIVPRGGGRVTVTAMERTDMKLCAPGELPAGLS